MKTNLDFEGSESHHENNPFDGNKQSAREGFWLAGKSRKSSGEQ